MAHLLVLIVITWGSLWCTQCSGLKFTIPHFQSNSEWAPHNQAIKQLLGPLHHELSQNLVSPKFAADEFSNILISYFSTQEDFLQQKQSESYIDHTPKNLTEAQKAKNSLRKKAFRKNATEADKKAFRQAIKAVSYFKKQANKNKDQKTTTYQESLYHRNFYNFSKDICNGTFGNESHCPTFSAESANMYYPGKYSKPVHLDFAQLHWFPHLPVENKTCQFDLSHVTPKFVKSVLQKKKPTSAPGPDGLMYGLMRNIPSTHHFLATLFSKMLMTPDPPDSWSQSSVTLIYKAGSTDDPANFRMISLTSCVSKLFHQILADRTVKYVTTNNFIDTKVQKAFINGINGCIEHNITLQEVICHAKSNKKTAHITFFDLADAFGSVSHSLITDSMRRFDMPENITNYIKCLYSRLNGSVKGQNWTSNTFTFKKGVFQGDPLSPIIFLICFNPVLEYLSSIREKYGYDLQGHKIITTPYADDFNLITGHKTQHQKIINELEKYTTSMGLTLKPSKCRSLSISAGKPNPVKFTINKNIIKTVDEDPQKFLGSIITLEYKPQELFEYIRDKLQLKLVNIDKALVRNEYKLSIYSRYMLPSCRFLLTVHDVRHTHLEKLDSLTEKYIKKWFGIPSHGANTAIVHDSKGYNIPRISDLYYECHSLAHSRSRIKGDDQVQIAIDSKIQRESQWTKQKSTVTYSEQIHERAANHSNDSNSWPEMKKSVKKCLQQDRDEFWKNKIEPLIFQGDFLKLLEQEESDLNWKSIMYNMPLNILKFATNACINALPSNDNLLRWGKRLTSKCNLCGNTGTLLHVLNACPQMLDRYSWRHNNILEYLLSVINSSDAASQNKIKTYADLEGHRIAGGTIPPNVLPSQQIPDIVIHWVTSNKLTIIELTVPFETNIKNANDRKIERYSSLCNDLKDQGIETQLHALEVGSRGLLTKSNIIVLKSVFKSVSSHKSHKLIFNHISKLSLLGSYAIFNSRKEPNWNVNSYLKI